VRAVNSAANDPTHIPPLTEQVKARLRMAYDRTELARHYISFEAAIGDDCLRLALSNLAECLERNTVPAWSKPYDEKEIGI